MILAGRPAKILLIDTNVYFSKRLSDALKREGFEVTCSTQPSFALTTLEYDAPTAIVCSTHMREMGALDIARLVRADSKNSTLPIIALGDGSQRALMEAFQAGCDDYVDRTRQPGVLATHIRNIIISKAEGFQPTQMLTQSDTSLSGSLTHHDLPGVMQMLGHAHQTGALHINSGETDALLFFDAGEIIHAECASLFGDEAVIYILKNCMRNNSGVYKFAYGSATGQRTVLRSATDLMLDAMREIDESAHAAGSQPAELSAVTEFPELPVAALPQPVDQSTVAVLDPTNAPLGDDSTISTLLDHLETEPYAPEVTASPSQETPFAAELQLSSAPEMSEPEPRLDSAETHPSGPHPSPMADLLESVQEAFSSETAAEPAPAEPQHSQLDQAQLPQTEEPRLIGPATEQAAEETAAHPGSHEPQLSQHLTTDLEPFANYSITPLSDIEDPQ